MVNNHPKNPCAILHRSLPVQKQSTRNLSIMAERGEKRKKRKKLYRKKSRQTGKNLKPKNNQMI